MAENLHTVTQVRATPLLLFGFSSPPPLAQLDKMSAATDRERCCGRLFFFFVETLGFDFAFKNAHLIGKKLTSKSRPRTNANITSSHRILQ